MRSPWWSGWGCGQIGNREDYIQPTRWFIFEVDGSSIEGVADGTTCIWLKKSATHDAKGWVQRKWERLGQIAPAPLIRHAKELTNRWRARATPKTLRQLRAKIVEQLTYEGFHVLPEEPCEVYAIELAEQPPDGLTRLYVGVTSDLGKRLAEHRGELEDGKPPGRAVRRFEYGRYRADLTEDIRRVHRVLAKEAEAQVSAWLSHRGFDVHGDGVSRRPTNARLVPDASWGELIAAFEEANDFQ